MVLEERVEGGARRVNPRRASAFDALCAECDTRRVPGAAGAAWEGHGAFAEGAVAVNRKDAPRLPVSYEGLRALQTEFARYQGEAFPEREPRFFALELAGETGELANLEKKEWTGRAVDAAAYTDEAADVVIAAINYANARGIDLGAAVCAKMAEIERRRLRTPRQ